MNSLELFIISLHWYEWIGLAAAGICIAVFTGLGLFIAHEWVHQDEV